MPNGRRLFSHKPERSLVATWLVWALSIAAAALLATYLRNPGP